MHRSHIIFKGSVLKENSFIMSVTGTNCYYNPISKKRYKLEQW
jgi:hypothetical protein